MYHLLLQLQKLAMLAFLVSSMLAIGMTLTLRAMAAPLRNGRFLLLALVLNFVIAPGFAWLLTRLIPLDRGYAVGLMLLGGAAGAPFLPKVVETARGDPAMAAALLGLLTVGTILFLPFALPFLIPGMQADPWSIARPLVLLIVLPLAFGMLARGIAPDISTVVAPVIKMIGNAAMILLFILLLSLNFHVLLGVIGSGAILAALLYFCGLFVTCFFLGGSMPEIRGVLALATVGRNFGAAIVPATNSFSDPNVTVMIVTGAIVCLVVSFLGAVWLRRDKISVPSQTMFVL